MTADIRRELIYREEVGPVPEVCDLHAVTEVYYQPEEGSFLVIQRHSQFGESSSGSAVISPEAFAAMMRFAE